MLKKTLIAALAANALITTLAYAGDGYDNWKNQQVIKAQAQNQSVKSDAERQAANDYAAKAIAAHAENYRGH